MKRLIAIAALALAGCGAEDPNLDLDEPTITEQAVTLPACTAANQGATYVVTTKRLNTTEVSTYECESGTWQLIKRCTGGVCIDY